MAVDEMNACVWTLWWKLTDVVVAIAAAIVVDFFLT